MHTFIILLLLITTSFTYTTEEYLIDFGSETQEQAWYPLNDGVMGGVSQGRLFQSENTILFTGSISFDNNGGFASIRNQFKRYDMSAYTEVEIRYRATGQNFAFQLEKDRR